MAITRQPSPTLSSTSRSNAEPLLESDGVTRGSQKTCSGKFFLKNLTTFGGGLGGILMGAGAERLTNNYQLDNGNKEDPIGPAMIGVGAALTLGSIWASKQSDRLQTGITAFFGAVTTYIIS